MNSKIYTYAFRKAAQIIGIALVLALVSMLVKVVAIPLFIVSSAISMIMAIKIGFNSHNHRFKIWLSWSATYLIAAFLSGVLQEGLFPS